MIKNKTEPLLKTAYTIEQLPKESVPELVIGGRSNVGKSSLINKLFGIKQLAHVSSKPGKTESINFYSYSKGLTIVDLPGYGFAKRSKRTLSYWGNIIEYYLSNRISFSAFLLLVDIRRGLQQEELDLLYFLEELGKDFYLVFTKIDKFSNNELTKFKRNLDFEMAKISSGRESFYKLFRATYFVSSLKNKGIVELKREIDNFISMRS